MKQTANDTMKVSVTKSRPGQQVGLTVEEEDNRIMVTDVDGLFKHNNLPIHVGDQVLEVNGTPVTDTEEFPRGLKDIQIFLRREWHVCVMVKKGPNADRDENAETEPKEAYGIVAKETEKWNRATEDSDSGDSSVDLSDDDEEHTTRRRSRSANSRKNYTSRSPSPFSGFTRDEKRTGKKKNPAQIKAAAKESSLNSLSDTTGTTLSMSADDDTPPRSHVRTCQTGTLVHTDENDAVMVSPLVPDRTTNPKPEGIEIKSIHATEHGITLELEDGKIVSISQEQLLTAVSEHKGLGDSLTSLTRNDSNSSGVGAPEKPKENDPEAKSPRRSSLSQSDSVSSLNNLLKDASVRMSLSALLLQRTEDTKTGDEHQPCSSRMSVMSKTSPSTKAFIDELRKSPKTPRKTSVPGLETTSLLLSSIREDEQLLKTPSSSKKKKKKKKRTKLREVVPQELSFHSTHTCIVNLIDPGDLMKIHGFKSKPKMNGATVEVIRRSKGHDGKRWDVRVISQKHVENSSFDASRLISVCIDNLKHFR